MSSRRPSPCEFDTPVSPDRGPVNVRGFFANGAWVRLLAYAGLFGAFVHLVGFRSDPTGTFDGIDWQRRRGHTDHVAHVGEARAFGTLGLQRVPPFSKLKQSQPRTRTSPMGAAAPW